MLLPDLFNTLTVLVFVTRLKNAHTFTFRVSFIALIIFHNNSRIIINKGMINEGKYRIFENNKGICTILFWRTGD